jgi:hypothetical protein
MSLPTVSQPVTISVRGEAQVNLAVTRVSLAVSDFTKPVAGLSLWARLRVAFQESERELFESEGATGRHGAWAPLSDAYVVIKTRKYPGKKILQQTGAMFDSLVGVTADTVLRVTALTMEVGTKRLAGLHWEASGGRPARHAIDVGDEQERVLFGRAMAVWGNDVRKEWGPMA